MYLDYNLHRNPSYLLKENFFKKNRFQSFTHLFYGNPITSFSNGQYVNTGQIQNYSLSRVYKLDIEIAPHLIYSLGSFSDPFTTEIGIAPKARLVVARGLYGVFQWIFPVQNDFIFNINTVSHRPGQIGVGYDWIWNGRFALTGYFGTLATNNYGLHLEFLGRSKDARWYFGGAYFITGSYQYYKQYYSIDPLQTKSGYAQLAYRWHEQDLTFRAIGDRYLNGDLGITFEALRQYGNIDIGFFAMAAQNATNGGFFFRCPLWPRKFYSNKLIQVRLPNTFANTYNVRNLVNNTPRARNHRPLFEEMIRFNPVFLNKQLIKESDYF